MPNKPWLESSFIQSWISRRVEGSWHQWSDFRCIVYWDPDALSALLAPTWGTQVRSQSFFLGAFLWLHHRLRPQSLRRSLSHLAARPSTEYLAAWRTYLHFPRLDKSSDWPSFAEAGRPGSSNTTSTASGRAQPNEIQHFSLVSHS